MAGKKNAVGTNDVPETKAVSEEVKELTLEEKLALASERVALASDGATERLLEHEKKQQAAQSEAKRRDDEMKKSRLDAEKEAKNVVERKLMEFSYAENYRKKLLKDKERHISPSKAKELQRKAEAAARAREEQERQIAELIENEKKEAEERRARSDAALARLAKAKELAEAAPAPVLEQAAIAEEEKPAAEAIAMPAADEAAAPENEYASDETPKADNGFDGRADEEDDFVLRIPEIKVNSPERGGGAAKAKADTTPKYPSDFSMPEMPAYDADAMKSFYSGMFNMMNDPYAKAEDLKKQDESIAAISQMLAEHDEELRRIKSERERILAERALAAEGRAKRNEEARAETERLTNAAIAAAIAKATAESAVDEEPVSEEVEAEPAAATPEEILAAELAEITKEEEIDVVEEPQPVYDEAAIKQDIEKMNRRSLRAYLEKSQRKLGKLQKSAEKAEKKLKRADEYERIERLLIALGIYKEIIDLLCENLKCCTLFYAKNHYNPIKRRIAKYTKCYNKLVDKYTDLTGEELTRPSAEVADLIIAGAVYTPIPAITYTKKPVIEIADENGEGGFKIAKKITMSEEKLHRMLLSAIKKKEASATFSQRCLLLAECITIERDIVEVLASKMIRERDEGKKKSLKKTSAKLSLAIAEYNAFVDEYELLSGTALVKASEGIPENILAGEKHTPLPEITYNRQRELLDKNVKVLAKEKRAAQKAVKKGEALPERPEQLPKYLAASGKRAAELSKLIKKADKAKKKKSGEALSIAILNSAMLRGKLVKLYRDNLIAAYRLDADRYIDGCKGDLLHAVQLYNEDITLYNDITGIKLIKVSPTIGDDIVSGRSYQVLPAIEWRKRFIELWDGEATEENLKKVFVFPTVSKIAKEQSLESETFVRTAPVGETALSNDRLVASPVNTEKYFKKLVVNKKRKIRKYEARLKQAERDINRELAHTEKQIEQAKDLVKAKFLVKKLVLQRDIIQRRIKALEYSVRFSDKKRTVAYKNSIITAMVSYNMTAEAYEALTGESFTPASAFIPYDIIDGRSYNEMPLIIYRKELIEVNGESVRVVATLVKQAKGQNEEKDGGALGQGGVIVGAVPVPTAYPDADTDAGEALANADGKGAKRKEKKRGKKKENAGASDTDESAQNTSKNTSSNSIAAGAVGAGAAVVKAYDADVQSGEYYESAEAYSTEAWNNAAMAQYHAELAENAAIEAKNRADMAEYHERFSAHHSASASNSAAFAEYHRDSTNISAIKADNAARMTAYYAATAEDALKRSAYLAAQAEIFENEATANAMRVQSFAQRANENVELADIAMLNAYDSLDRKVAVSVATAMTPSQRASTEQVLDEQGLRKYCAKGAKRERALEAKAESLNKNSLKATGNEKISAILDAIIATKARFDILADLLKVSVRSGIAKYKKHYKARLQGCINTYNTLVDRYSSISGRLLYKIDANPNKKSTAELILAGEKYDLVPDITYTRDFKSPGEENVVILRPGVVVEEAVSTTNFADRAKLAETVNKQISLDIDAVAKSVEYEIKMVERSENVTQKYRFGLSGDQSYKQAKKRISELKKDSIKAFEYERRDNERFYSVVYTNPLTAAISKKKLKKLIGRGGKNRLEREHDAKTLMRVRDDIARVRSNVIALLDERHKLNAELVALYTGTDVDPHGLPVSEKYSDKRMRAARRAHKKLKGKAKTVKQLNLVSDGAKIHLYDLMNKKIVAESNLALYKYRYKNEKHTRQGRRLLIKDIRETQKTIEMLDRDIKGFLKRAIRQQRDRSNEVWGYAIIVALVIIAAAALALGFVFRTQIAGWFAGLM